MQPSISRLLALVRGIGLMATWCLGWSVGSCWSLFCFPELRHIYCMEGTDYLSWRGENTCFLSTQPTSELMRRQDSAKPWILEEQHELPHRLIWHFFFLGWLTLVMHRISQLHWFTVRFMCLTNDTISENGFRFPSYLELCCFLSLGAF